MPARSCLRCNCILARDNGGPYCSPCEREEWVPVEGVVVDDRLAMCGIPECVMTFKRRTHGHTYCSQAHKQLAFARRSWARQAANTTPPALAPLNHKGTPDAIEAAPLRLLLRGSLPVLYRNGRERQQERGIHLLARLHAERFGGNWDSTARRLHRIMAGQKWVNRFFADEICTILAEDVYLEEGA